MIGRREERNPLRKYQSWICSCGKENCRKRVSYWDKVVHFRI